MKQRVLTGKSALLLLAMVGALAMGGCSGSNTSFPATRVSGSVVDGPIKGAAIRAFELKADKSLNTTPLATAETAADGGYTLNLPNNYSGTLVITASGGSYCAGSDTAQVSGGACPAGTVLTTLDIPLMTMAVVTNGNTVATAHVTPVSTAAMPAVVNAVTGAVSSGTLDLATFATNFANVSGGLTPDASPTDAAGLKPALAQINAMRSAAGATLSAAEIVGRVKSGYVVAAAATTPCSTFSIKQGGALSLMPDDPATAKDPTLLYDGTGGAKTSYAGNTTSPYFKERGTIDVDTLKAVMNDKTVLDVNDETVSYYSEIYTPVTVAVGSDSYKGYRLADVVVRATKFRPRDFNTGAFGATTVIVAFGAKPDGTTAGRVAAFSFSELIRTENGDKTIVAFEKNGAPLPPSEGAMAIIAGNDDDTLLRKVPRLMQIHVRNDYTTTSHALTNTDPALASFQITGQVQEQITVNATTLSATSSQGYYAVGAVGGKAITAFDTYYFQQYGPRHTNYWYGQGVRLTDVLDTAGLKYPDDKGACFVVVTSANNQPALFSCGELYNSPVGRGDGLAGSGNRSRHKGVLMVTDDFRSGSGGPVMMTCWDYESCTLLNPPELASSYTVAMNTTTGSPVSTQVNKQMIALVSTEDYLPFQPQGRWFPYSKNAAGANACTGPTNCIPWVDVGERLQQNIKTMQVFFAAGTGNNGNISTTPATPGGGSGAGGSGGSGSASTTVCTHDQVMAGTCVKSDGTACSHLDFLAGTTCYVPL